MPTDRVRGRTAALAVLLAVVAAVAVAPGIANAEFCRPVMPDHPRNVRGDTFEATVIGFYDTGDNPAYTYVALDVSHVYAAQSDRLRDGRRIDVFINSCDGIGLLGFDEGDRLLISTSALDEGDGPATWNSAVWRRANGVLDLLILSTPEGGRIWFTNDRRMANASTVRDALVLVAPAAVGMPDTATLPQQRDDGTPGRALLVLITFVAALLAMTLRPMSWRQRR